MRKNVPLTICITANGFALSFQKPDSYFSIGDTIIFESKDRMLAFVKQHFDEAKPAKSEA